MKGHNGGGAEEDELFLLERDEAELGDEQDALLIGVRRKGAEICTPASRTFHAASIATINEYGDLFVSEDAALFHARSLHDGKLRSSIFSADALVGLDSAVGPATTDKMLSGFLGLLFQSVVFAFAAVESALYPVVLEWAVWNEAAQRKELLFMPTVVYFAYYTLSASVGLLLALLSHGRQGGRDCFNLGRGVLNHVMPLAIVLSIVEIADVCTMVIVPATIKSVVSQVRLPAVALIGVFVFGRKQTLVQWCLIFGVTFSVLGYALANNQAQAAALEAALNATDPASANTIDADEVGLLGPTVVFCLSILTATTYALSELAMQKVKFPFVIQMSQARICSAALCLVSSAIMWLWHGRPNFFVGWSRRTIGLIIGLVIRDWTQTFILKVLNSVWKALSAGVGVGITYATDVCFNGKSFDMILLCFLLTTIIDVFGYSFSRL